MKRIKKIKNHYKLKGYKYALVSRKLRKRKHKQLNSFKFLELYKII